VESAQPQRSVVLSLLGLRLCGESVDNPRDYEPTPEFPALPPAALPCKDAPAR
jgi:hypothetical protein